MEDTLKQHLIERLKEDNTKKSVGKSIEEKPILKAQPLILQRFSPDETVFNCLEGIAEIKKQKIEQNLLYYESEEITIAGKKRLENTIRDYYCLVQGEEGRFYPNLVENILRLRNQLTKREYDYIRIMQGKCWKNEEDVLQGIVHTRRELENAEKVYLISRWRCFHSEPSTYLNHVCSKHSDEYLLEKMAHFKRKLMKLEGEYVGLIQVGRESLFHKKSPEFSEDMFQSTVRRKRDLLLVDEYISLVGAKRTLPNDESIYLESLQDAVEIMLLMRFISPKIDPLAHDFNKDYIIDLLEKIVHSRTKFLKLEDEYLCLLQERYTKNHIRTSTSFDVNLIHSNYVWECAMEMTVRWRNDWRLQDYKYICHMEIKELKKYKESSLVNLKKTLWKAEEKYCQLMQKRYLTILKNMRNLEILKIMFFSRRKMRNLEIDFNRILRRRMGIRSYIYQLEDREFLMSKVEEIEDRYFDQLKHNNASKYFLQHVPPKKTAFEISSNDIGEEREFLTKLYNSIKSYNFYCSKCETCISRKIQFSLKFEDDKELLSEVLYEDEEVPEICYQVLQRFLNSHNLCCPNCKTRIKMVTIQHAQKLKSRSTALKQTSTISSPSKGSGELLANIGTFGSEASKDFREESGTSNSVVVNISLDERETTLQHNSRARKWEIQRSIVLGGLIESITTLVIVTSAASVDLSNGNILALALTNLIAGLFVVRHNLSGLKKNGYNGVEVEGKQYKEVLIDTMYYLSHFTIAFLSFLFCGLVPLLVYAFSFLKSGNKNLKMIATAGASLSCTAILAIQKAHIERPQNWRVYVKTVATYVSIGVVAFALSYLAGYMIAQLTDKFSWDL